MRGLSSRSRDGGGRCGRVVKRQDSGFVDDLALDDRALIERCEVDAYRSHGPGGQKRNKTSSAIRLRHRATGLIATAVEDRSQHVNKARAVRRMREAIAHNVRQSVDLDAYRPSRQLLDTLRGAGSERAGRREARYFVVIRELLNVLAACDMHVAPVAEKFGCSTGQFVKFVLKDGKLCQQVNQLRVEAGLRRLD